MAINKTFTFTCIPERPDPDNGTYRVHKGQSASPTAIHSIFVGSRLVAPQTVVVSINDGDHVRISYTNEDGEIYYTNSLGEFEYDD